MGEQVAMMVADFKAAEMWLYLKTPEVSDGNNFGVEVQAYVLGELKAMRTEAAAMMDAVSAYLLLRGATLERSSRRRPRRPTTSPRWRWMATRRPPSRPSRPRPARPRPRAARLRQVHCGP